MGSAPFELLIVDAFPRYLIILVVTYLDVLFVPVWLSAFSWFRSFWNTCTGLLLCWSDILSFQEICFGKSPEGKNKLKKKVLNPGLCLFDNQVCPWYLYDPSMCVMNSLLHVLCHGEVLHCDPFIHEFQCSKHQDEHSWFCFGVLVDLVYRYRYFPSGWSFSWFVAFRAADNFVQFCEADFHTRKLHSP